MLEDHAVVHSERALTDVTGKDTGHYWKSGASNVHWVIATDQQIGEGINEALSRVKAPGVLVEGNSFTFTVEPDFFVMVARGDRDLIKSTARQALQRASAVYLTDKGVAVNKDELRKRFERLKLNSHTPIFWGGELVNLQSRISELFNLSRQTQSRSFAS